ncbi:MAG: diguanylate cyclase [Roseburia sp.]|nr:diguanylate cyclase [Roseburia sp.]
MSKKALTKKNLLRTAWIIYALASILVWVPQIDHLLTKDYEEISNYLSLDDDWEVRINGDDFPGVSLDSFHFPAVSTGDEVIMERTLPDDWDLEQMSLRIYIRHSAVNVYINDALIYEYGHDRMEQHKTVGSGFQFVNFPSEYKGQRIKIEFYVSEDKIFSKLDSVRLYPWKNAYRVIMTENRLPLFFGDFLFIFGLVVCIMTIFAIVFSKKYIRLLCISAFSLCMGLWTVCYYRVLLVYAIPLYAISLMEYVAFYIAPIPLLLYLREDVINLGSKIFRMIYRVLLLAYLAAFGTAMALHSTDKVHLVTVLPYMVAFLVLCLGFSFLVVVLNFKGSKIQNRLYQVGMLIVVVCIGYDLVGYGSDRYFGNSSFLAVKGVSSIGVMMFIIILFASFYIEMTQKMILETERNSLIKSAYTDELTQLHNRRYCMEYMHEIEEEKNSDYTVICFDLNNLKIVNDTYGHGKGDILIKSSADVLRETFEDYGVVARMGGDEFISVIRTADRGKIDRLMERFGVNIQKKNRQAGDLNLSIAWGAATGKESEKGIEKVYQLADNRMYEHKKKMKKEALDKQQPGSKHMGEGGK